MVFLCGIHHRVSSIVLSFSDGTGLVPGLLSLAGNEGIAALRAWTGRTAFGGGVRPAAGGGGERAGTTQAITADGPVPR